MIYLAIGRRKLGKTTLSLSMARKCPARILFDPRGLIDVSERSIRVRDKANLDLAIDMLADKVIDEVIITPDTDVQGLFNATAQHVKSWSQEFEHAPRKERALMFLIDEARFIDLKAAPAFEYVSRAVPTDLVHIVITAHRPSDISTDLRAISDHWLMFRCSQEHDLKVIGDRAGEQVRAEVQKLNPHEFIDWDDATATWKSFKNPRAWFVPLKTAGGEPETILPGGGENPIDKRFPLLKD